MGFLTFSGVIEKEHWHGLATMLFTSNIEEYGSPAFLIMEFDDSIM